MTSDQNSHDDNEKIDEKKAPPAELPNVKLGNPNNIFIMGIMASGKSSVGWVLAKLIGYGFVDTDREVEKRCKKSVSRIFTEDGEQKFRDIERAVIADLKNVRGYVVALGGGAVMDDQSWETIVNLGAGVWLNPQVEEVARRLLMNPDEMRARPLIGDLAPTSDAKTNSVRAIDPEAFKTLCHRLSALNGMRQSRYRQAKVIIDTGYSPPEELAKLAAKELAGANGVPAIRERLRKINPLNKW